MPERDGYEVAAFVKGDPHLAHIPVLLLTGAFEPVDEARASAVGCDGVLAKPFEPQLLIRPRERAAGRRRTPRRPPRPPARGRTAGRRARRRRYGPDSGGAVCRRLPKRTSRSTPGRWAIARPRVRDARRRRLAGRLFRPAGRRLRQPVRVRRPVSSRVRSPLAIDTSWARPGRRSRQIPRP